MVTILRAHGLRFVIFTDDHEPAHVHVFGDGEAKINLVGQNGEPKLVWVRYMSTGDVRRAFCTVCDERETFMARWRDIHG